ncbi:MAG TPA: Ig-like domain-containing protein, partial [Gemmatimonadales bacterium]
MTRLKRLRFWTVAGLLALGSLRCSDGSVNPPSASAIEMVAGDQQNGLVNQPLPAPLVVRVLDESGDPVSGITVHWSASGGGSVSAETVETGANGTASVNRILGSTPGEQTTTATVTGLDGSPVTFLATATDGTSPVLALAVQPAGPAQTGSPLPTQPVVQLKDAEGNDQAEAGVPVTASLVGATGSLGGTVTRETADNGAATFTDLAITAPAGSYTLRFSAPGTIQVLSQPVTVTDAGQGTVVLLTTAPPVSALSGEVFDPSVQPVVEVKNGNGSPVANAQVTVAKATGSGTLEGTTTAVSDASGVARFLDLGIVGTGSHTLVFTAGTQSVTSSPINVTALPTEATSGKWGPVIDWDVVPLHMSLLHSGKILAWGKTDAADTMGMPRIWDPANPDPRSATMLAVDTMLFCAGHALLPDGRLMSSGGHTQDDKGIAVTYFFDKDGNWQRGPDMAHGRWYPTVTVLPDGRVLTMGGRDELGQVVTTPEIWEGGQWVELPGAGTLNIPYYPRNFVAPDGRIFYAGERIRSRWFEVDGSTASGRGRWSGDIQHVWQFNRDYGTAVMYEPGKILYAGGGGHTGWGQSPDTDSPQPTATAEIIDLNDAAPQWRNTAPMSVPRRHLNSTILPDGQVLVTGGTRGAGFVNIDPGLAARDAEVWNPATGEWTTLAANQRMRTYHSVSMLLP